MVLNGECSFSILCADSIIMMVFKVISSTEMRLSEMCMSDRIPSAISIQVFSVSFLLIGRP